MGLRIKPAKGHQLPKPPTAGLGKFGASLETSKEVAHQDEPTDGHPVNAHKLMAGNKDPGRLPSFK